MTHSFHAADVLTEAEVSLALGALSSKAPTGVRNRALISLLFSSGLRLGEALGLTDEDVDLERGIVQVGHNREVRVFGSALEFLGAWRLTRTNRGLGSDAPFFCTLKGGRLKDAYVRAMLGRTAKRAGIGKRLHAFGLRRSFAVHAFRSGLELEELATHLGHKNTQATFRYLADASELLANQSARALPFDLVTAPAPEAAPPPAAQAAPAPEPEPRVEPAPEPAALRVEEPPAALPKSVDTGAAVLGSELKVVRPISLEEL